MRESFAHYCARFRQQELLDQWDREANAPLTPETVSYGSRRKVWWRCSQGHRWQAAVYARTGRSCGCPYCAHRKALPGFNDLASQNPGLAAQWHPTKNGDLTPDQVLAGSSRRVWWQCDRGHSWNAMVKSRSNGAGCPYCSGRQVENGSNDLAARCPDLAAQWHPTKNGALTPRDVLPGSRRKVWWQCDKGHVWLASVVTRGKGGAGCPVCAGKQVIPGENDLATARPDLAAQWDREKNGDLTPQGVSPYSNRKAWWRCDQGHSWRATVSSRAWGSDCPYCAGRKVWPGFNDLASQDPDLAAQWAQDLNGTLTPEQVTLGSRKKVWWRCDQGHLWKAVVYSRTGKRRSGCPVCAGRIKQKTPPVWGERPPGGAA